jgi:hypothetical protein
VRWYCSVATTSRAPPDADRASQRRDADARDAADVRERKRRMSLYLANVFARPRKEHFLELKEH